MVDASCFSLEMPDIGLETSDTGLETPDTAPARAAIALRPLRPHRAW
jgi:hypothetical protein